MPMEEYAAQSFLLENEQSYYMTEIFSAGLFFATLPTITGSGKRSYVYCYDPEYLENNASFVQWSEWTQSSGAGTGRSFLF
ncbi:hypothetical protein BT93_H0598 [Corymbia citriodora subsp. variegata]|nr:hypothetical protein BT93_H0598 [Corymbia citriodora subsp. variegata]